MAGCGLIEFFLWFMLCMLILNVSLCWCCSKIGSNETVLKNHFQSLLFHCRLFGVHVECWMKILILIWFSLLLAWLLAWQMNRAMNARLKAKPASSQCGAVRIEYIHWNLRIRYVIRYEYHSVVYVSPS